MNKSSNTFGNIFLAGLLLLGLYILYNEHQQSQAREQVRYQQEADKRLEDLKQSIEDAGERYRFTRSLE